MAHATVKARPITGKDVGYPTGVSSAEESTGLLIGRAADPAAQREIRSVILAAADVTGVDELLTMHFGPEQVLVAAKVHFSDHIGADEAEDVAGVINTSPG